MKPLVIDTSVWVDWFRGKNELKSRISGRVVYLPSIVLLELYSGVKDSKSMHQMDHFVSPFIEHRRIIIPQEQDFITAGKVLSELKWSASKYANDALIVLSARRIGAEVMTLNKKDFEPMCRRCSVTCTIL